MITTEKQREYAKNQYAREKTLSLRKLTAIGVSCEIQAEHRYNALMANLRRIRKEIRKPENREQGTKII